MRTLTHEEATARAEAVSVASYQVELDLTRGESWFGSRSTVRFTAAQGASAFLDLDCVELVSATLDGRPLSLQGSRIPLDGLGGEHVAVVEARCAYTRTGEGLHRFVDPADGAVYVYAMAFLDDAQRIFACFDQPDLKATFQLSVRAPELVLSNTRATMTDGVHVFAPTRPLPTYLVTLAAGPWHGVQRWHDGIELGVWCRASLAEHLDSDELLEVTAQCLDFQQELFGSRYPFGDSYDQVFVPEFNAGAMENPGMVTFADEHFVFRSRATEGQRSGRAKVIAHEMSHMWFGDLVTLRWWDGVWLNESFAELMGFDTIAETTRFTGAWSQFCVGRKAGGYRADQLPTTHPIASRVTDTRAALQNFDGISYSKGASSLRQLVAFVGREAFFAGLRSYLARYAFGNTDLPDLLVELEQASGRDLRGWAREWLEVSGVNTLRPHWDGAALVVVQEGAQLRDHVMGIAAYDLREGGLTLRQRVEVEVSGPATAVPGVRPADLVLLNDGDLTFAKVRFDDRSLRTVLESLHLLEDQLARALCWSALWDATRDAELPARALVRAVVTSVHAEKDPTLAEALLTQAQEAAARLAPPAEQEHLAQQIAQACWAADTAAGSDLQLVRARAAIGTSVDVPRLQVLLDGTDVPAGLVVDTDLRWLLVRRLAVLGASDTARVEAELAADRTASGELQAAAARVSFPDARSKRESWDLLVGRAFAGSLTNSQARVVAKAFWQPGQADLLRPYVPEYAALVPRLWDGLSPELAASLTVSLFPSALIEQQVHDELHAALEALPPAGKRPLLEQLGDLQRALRAQGAG